MKKYSIVTIFLFLIFSSKSFAELELVSGNDYVKVYVEKTNFIKKEGFLYYWLTWDLSESDEMGFTSWKELNITDCSQPYSYKTLSKTFYNSHMGEGGVRARVPKETLDNDGILYTVSGSMEEAAAESSCKLSLF